jgi:hypothetical protein
MNSKSTDGISHESYFIDYRSAFNEVRDDFKKLRNLCYKHVRANDIKFNVKNYKHHMNPLSGDEIIKFKCDGLNFDIPRNIITQIKLVSDSFYRYLDVAYPGDFSEVFGHISQRTEKEKKREHKINEYCLFQKSESNDSDVIDLCHFTMKQLKQAYIDRENLALTLPTYIDNFAPGIWSSEDYKLENDVIEPVLNILSCSDLFKMNCKNLHYDDPFQFGKNLSAYPKLKFRDGFIMEGKTTSTLTEYFTRDSADTELCLELNWLWRRRNSFKQSMLSECENEFLILLSYILKLFHKLTNTSGDKTILLDRSILGHYAFNRSMDNNITINEAVQNSSIFLVLFGNYDQEYSIIFKKDAKWPILNTPGRLFEFNIYKSFEHITNHYTSFKLHFMEGLERVFDIYDNLDERELVDFDSDHTYYEISNESKL